MDEIEEAERWCPCEGGRCEGSACATVGGRTAVPGAGRVAVSGSETGVVLRAVKRPWSALHGVLSAFVLVKVGKRMMARERRQRLRLTWRSREVV